jgi:hypothetical protein
MPNNTETMPFGEHAGLAYYELVADHRDYVDQLLRQHWLDPAIARKRPAKPHCRLHRP